MKKFFRAVRAVKESAAMNYTIAMCCYLFFLSVFHRTESSLSTLFSLLLVSVAAGVMQVVAFTGLVIKKLAYGWRLILFVVPFGGILSAAAAVFDWFPVENPGAWGLFWLIFLVIFLAITVAIELYYRLSGRKYDDRLDWYRQNRGQTASPEEENHP